MSRYHANRVWQSKDGSWNIGFYAEFDRGFREDEDSEWDRDWDYDHFFWVSLGHSSDEAAMQAWKGANPGSHDVLSYSKKNAAESAEYDRMAQWCLHPELEAEHVKKENARLKREHTKKLKEQFAAADDFKGRRVRVVIKLDDKPWEYLGMSQSDTGFLKQEGDWLVIDGVKVKNMKTGRLNSRLREVEIAQVSRW